VDLHPVGTHLLRACLKLRVWTPIFSEGPKTKAPINGAFAGYIRRCRMGCLAQQGQYTLRQLVGLGNHGGAGLLQDL
jgi:hypothetical protein